MNRTSKPPPPPPGRKAGKSTLDKAPPKPKRKAGKPTGDQAPPPPAPADPLDAEISFIQDEIGHVDPKDRKRVAMLLLEMARLLERRGAKPTEVEEVTSMAFILSRACSVGRLQCSRLCLTSGLGFCL